jgi:hypothetical protein
MLALGARVALDVGLERFARIVSCSFELVPGLIFSDLQMLFFHQFLVETSAFSPDRGGTGCRVVTARNSALWDGEP